MSLSYSADDFSTPNRGAALGPLLVGAACAAVAFAGQTKLGAWLRGFLSVPREYHRSDPIRRRLDAGWSLPRLRDSILGRHKTVLVTRYGVPGSAALGNIILTGTDARGAALFRADTWYYILDPAARSVMSIRFHGSVAGEVEFFDTP
jgi:hypothetical protein